jgi:hypothetical protein
LAGAAWDGFLRTRKLGASKIERLIRTGEFQEGSSPLEQSNPRLPGMNADTLEPETVHEY